MESFKIEYLSFTYPGKTDKTLTDINFTVREGEFVLICGKSGCGKTTLLRLLNSSLSPFGETSGNVYFNGKPLSDFDIKEQAANIGFVMQNPENQIVTDKVWHELAFGLESLGIEQNEIRTKVSEMASFFGMQTWFHKKTSELSGGQKQLLNLASVMVMQPSVLILDEPTGQLDPIAAGEFLKTIEKINHELGTTVILTEHRLEESFPLADRVIVMDNGKVIADETPEKVAKILKDKGHDMYKALPTPARVYACVENSSPCPLTVKDGRNWLFKYSKENTLNAGVIPKNKLQDNTNTIIEVKDVWFRYEKQLPDIIRGFNLSVAKGELFCLVGGNGVGKTTALSLLSGIGKPYRGDIKIKGESISKIPNLYNTFLGVLPQNPQSVFIKKTVYLDLMDVLSEKNLTKEEKEQKVYSISALCKITSFLSSHPYDLSGGEQERTALAKILLTEPEILLLDEPTKGMDAQFKEEFANILLDLKAKNTTIVMVSHDIEFCAEYADRCALMFDGSITSSGTPREFFKGKNFYTTSANRMARGIIPDAILAEDIILSCGATLPSRKEEVKFRKIEQQNTINSHNAEKTYQTACPIHNKQSDSKTLFTALLSLLSVVLTIYAGTLFFDGRKYYFISLLIILETLLPFSLLFEMRKPKEREIIVISVLCAIAVAGRCAFFMTPHFKPTVAILIVTGLCFGAETGFLVGAITGFVSNFFFGQGPWTPWQMVALGIIGGVAGLLFKKNIVRKNKLFLCIFGFLMTLIIYGCIMNPASIIMWQNNINWEMIVSTCIAGMPLDLVHAFATAVFLWFISEPLIEKVERIKEKYGLFTK